MTQENIKEQDTDLFDLFERFMKAKNGETKTLSAEDGVKAFAATIKFGKAMDKAQHALAGIVDDKVLEEVGQLIVKASGLITRDVVPRLDKDGRDAVAAYTAGLLAKLVKEQTGE
jgi:hypothetical protein